METHFKTSGKVEKFLRWQPRDGTRKEILLAQPPLSLALYIFLLPMSLYSLDFVDLRRWQIFFDSYVLKRDPSIRFLVSNEAWQLQRRESTFSRNKRIMWTRFDVLEYLISRESLLIAHARPFYDKPAIHSCRSGTKRRIRLCPTIASEEYAIVLPPPSDWSAVTVLEKSFNTIRILRPRGCQRIVKREQAGIWK